MEIYTVKNITESSLKFKIEYSNLGLFYEGTCIETFI